MLRDFGTIHPTIFFIRFKYALKINFRHGLIVQWLERCPYKAKVSGSSPVGPILCGSSIAASIRRCHFKSKNLVTWFQFVK